jgi:hypothetical protein
MTMDSVQLPPLGGVSNAAPPSSGTGGPDGSQAANGQTQKAANPPQPLPQPKPIPTPAQQVPIAARAGAAAAQAAEAARAETPAFSLDVGLIRGSFNVFVDVTDRDSHRFIARIYGPKGQVPPETPTAKQVVKA